MIRKQFDLVQVVVIAEQVGQGMGRIFEHSCMFSLEHARINLRAQ